MMATPTPTQVPANAAPASAPAIPATMGPGSAMSSLANSAPVQTPPASTVKPASNGYLSETGTPSNKATFIPTGLPNSQISMLHDLASLSLGFADPVAPGDVTKQQNQVLDAWQKNAASDYSQYMFTRGMTAVSSDPGALFNEERLVTQAQWSSADTRSALKVLKLSAEDWDKYEKLEEEKRKSMMGEIFGAVELVAGIAIAVTTGWTGVGAVAGGTLAAQGAKQLAS